MTWVRTHYNAPVPTVLTLPLYIIIIIKSHCWHGFPRLSLTIQPYHESLPPSLADNILYLYRAVVGRFLLVNQNWHVHMKEVHKKRHLWVSPCFSNSGECPRGVMVKVMDYGIVVSEFVLQSRYYVHFRANTLGKTMNPLILLAMG